MSILSSTRSGFYSRLTKEYLLSHGYVQMESQTFRDRYFYRHNLYSKHYIKTLEKKSKLVFYVYFVESHCNNSGYRYVHTAYINTIAALKELEQMWDETNTKKKVKLKRKLIEKYNKIQ